MAEKLQLTKLGKKQQSSMHGNVGANSKGHAASCPIKEGSSEEASVGPKQPVVSQTHKAIESGISAGFQLACAAGPLCQAPLWGVAFDLAVGVAVADFDFSEEAWQGLNLLEGPLGPISGQVRTYKTGRRPHILATCLAF